MFADWVEYLSGRVPLGIFALPLAGVVFTFVWWMVWWGTRFYSLGRFWRVLLLGWFTIVLTYTIAWRIKPPLPVPIRVNVTVSSPNDSSSFDASSWVVAYSIYRSCFSSSEPVVVIGDRWSRLPARDTLSLFSEVPGDIAERLRVSYKVSVGGKDGEVKVKILRRKGSRFKLMGELELPSLSLGTGAIWLTEETGKRLGIPFRPGEINYPSYIDKNALFEWGECLKRMGNGEVEESEASLVRLVRNFPRWLYPRQELARLWLTFKAQTRYSELDTLLLSTLSLNKEDPYTLMLLGWYSLEFRDWERAESALKLALHHGGEHPGLWILLSRLSSGRWKDLPLRNEEEMMRRALLLDGSYEVGRVLLANHLRTRGLYFKALEVLQEGLALHPSSIPLLVTRSVVELEQGDPARSLKTCQSVLNLQPEHPKALYNQGLAFLRMRRWQEAAESFYRAYHAKGNPNSLYYLGLACEAQGDYQQAISWYQKRLANLQSADDKVALAVRDRIARIKSYLASSSQPSPADTSSRLIAPVPQWGWEGESSE